MVQPALALDDSPPIQIATSPPLEVLPRARGNACEDCNTVVVRVVRCERPSRLSHESRGWYKPLDVEIARGSLAVVYVCQDCADTRYVDGKLHQCHCGAVLVGYRKHAKHCRGSRCRTQASRDRKAAQWRTIQKRAETDRFMKVARLLGDLGKGDLVELLSMQGYELRTAIEQIVEVRGS